MYIPEAFKVSSAEKIDSFIERFSFATVVTPDTEIQATHCPVISTRNERGMVLSIHFARSNPHCKSIIDGKKTLVIFPGPHGYISPTWYRKLPAVPTWNYGVVHVHGVPRIVEDPDRILGYFKDLVAKFEGPAGVPADIMPPSLIGQLSSAILLFEIDAQKLEAKFKLGQNRGEEDQRSMLEHLRKSSGPQGRGLADFMDEFGDLEK